MTNQVNLIGQTVELSPTAENYAQYLGIVKPAIGSEFPPNYKNELLLCDFLAMTGAEKPVQNETYQHFEDTYLDTFNTSFGVANFGNASGSSGGGSTATGAGCGIAIQLSAADCYTFNGAVYSFPRPHDFINVNGVNCQIVNKITSASQIPSGPIGFTATVSIVAGSINTGTTSVASQHIIIVFPEDPTQIIDSTATTPVAAGETFFYTGYTFGEGTNYTNAQGTSWPVIEYTNTTMIMQDSFTVTNSARTDLLWFDVPASAESAGGPCWTYQVERNTYRRWKLRKELALIFQNGIQYGISTTNLTGTGAYNNTTVDPTGFTTYQTNRASEGLLHYIETKGGYIQGYSTGLWNLWNTKNLSYHWERVGTTASEYLWMGGISLRDAFETSLQDAFKNGGVTYGAFAEGGSDLAVNMGYKSIESLGYTFHLKNYQLYNHINYGGQGGYPNQAILIPGGTTSLPKTGENAAYMRWRPKMMGSYSRAEIFQKTGGFFGEMGTATNRIDQMTGDYLCEGGFEFSCSTNYGVIVNNQ